MSRVSIIVEGATERSFVNGPLAEALRPHRVYPTAKILGRPGHKGGRTNYARVRDDLERQLKQDATAYCSTMIDFYGLGEGFPGTPLPANLTDIQKVERIESLVKTDICDRLPGVRAEVRLIPYLSLHEYEALLFSDPNAFAAALKEPHKAGDLYRIRNGFSTPEDINDNPQKAPSKRVLAIYPRYQKIIDGTEAARAVGIEKMREECPHFRSWIGRLEALPDL